MIGVRALKSGDTYLSFAIIKGQFLVNTELPKTTPMLPWWPVINLTFNEPLSKGWSRAAVAAWTKKVTAQADHLTADVWGRTEEKKKKKNGDKVSNLNNKILRLYE